MITRVSPIKFIKYMKYIKLSNNKKVAIVDDEDFPYLSRFRWRESNKGDVVASFGVNLIVCMSQFLIAGRGGARRLHKNDDRLDNRKENLFLAGANVRTQKGKKSKGKSSIYKGVSFNNHQKKWIAGIKYDGKHYFLGSFLSEEKAAEAYNKKAKEFYGDTAYLNSVKNLISI